MRTKRLTQFGTAITLGLMVGSVMAAVSPEEAVKLGTTLTPLGAEKTANADGSIPEWTGGLPTDAAAVDADGFLGDPFAHEKPLFIITAANAEQYKDKLSPGQMAMFKRYAATYKVPVYPTHRTMAAPQAIYDAAKKSALKTTAVDDGNSLANFADSRYYAFPIPKNGQEVIWNHLTRYLGGSAKRLITQMTPQVNGAFTTVHFEDDFASPSDISDLDMEKGKNILFYFKQRVTKPSRLAGSVLLLHETIDQTNEPRMAWLYNAGQRRVRRAPQVAYDGPATAADGMRTADNFGLFNGALDRYDWKLIGKKEMYIPYNSYKLDSRKLKYEDIIKAGHINQDHTRYELHRVWEVEATLKSGERHIYAKRHFFIDEDSWLIAYVDHYDGRGQLWRVGEGHPTVHYKDKVALYSVEAIYDLIAGRYIALGLKNEEKHGVEFGIKAKISDYTPAALRNAGIR